MIAVLLVDDDALVRSGIRALLELEDDVVVVAEAAGGAEAVSLAARLHPRVVIMDIGMPGMDGIEATRRLAGSGARVVLVSTFGGDERLVAARESGATGVILKDAAADELVPAVRAAAR